MLVYNTGTARICFSSYFSFNKDTETVGLEWRFPFILYVRLDSGFVVIISGHTLKYRA